MNLEPGGDPVCDTTLPWQTKQIGKALFGEGNVAQHGFWLWGVTKVALSRPTVGHMDEQEMVSHSLGNVLGPVEAQRKNER